KRVRKQAFIFRVLTGFVALAMQSPMRQVWLSTEICLLEHVKKKCAVSIGKHICEKRSPLINFFIRGLLFISV
ncbi:hypothetical protein, partial [Latilactobacillus curvatus]|uniref:hypothetical protein n=1 Tax=Latilactobacillus curvatus TaxID=28038 RepID=UPI001A7E1B1C